MVLTQPNQHPVERRRESRRRVLKSALIVFNHGHSTMNCAILDTSAGGAKLAPGDPFSCPSEFLLKPNIGEPRNCEVVWRKGMGNRRSLRLVQVRGFNRGL